MRRPPPGLPSVAFALALLTTACATRVRPVTMPVAAVAVATAPAAPAPPVVSFDPVTDLIAVSRGHFDAGRRELGMGHLDQARTNFNRALEVLLESPSGARLVPRTKEHFDRLVERISSLEMTALAQGDGFTEKKYDPASIDDLLAIATFQAPTPAITDAVAADLQATTYDIDIPTNARVLSYVELFTGRLKSYLEEALGRSARYLPMIQNVFRAEGVPLDLAYVPLVESAFKPNALSRAKAKGLWQFMKGTALENGLKHDWYIDERTEPEKATLAAARYLKTLYGMFGNWHLALASYNGGPGRLQRAVKQSGKTDFWELSASSRYLPRETRDYVPLILAAVIIARNPLQYGMTIPDLPIEIRTTETVTLPTAVDLRRIAEWSGTTTEVIKNLNPALRRWTTPLRAKDFELRVPQGAAEVIEAHLAATETSELAPLNWYAVRKGETLVTIARKLKVNRTDLTEANYLSVRSRVTPGQKLVIPRAPNELLATRTEAPAPVAEPRPTHSAALAAPVAPRAERAPVKVVHRVRKGETLFSLARSYHTTVASLRTWNGISGTTIKVGDRLTIFTNRTNAD